jgi:hypothetical protein
MSGLFLITNSLNKSLPLFVPIWKNTLDIIIIQNYIYPYNKRILHVYYMDKYTSNKGYNFTLDGMIK